MKVLGELFQRYSHLVYGVCLKYLQDRDEAKDAVMEIFEKLIEDLLKHEVSNFKSWLHVLSKNFCLMKLRKRKPTSKSGPQTISSHADMEFALPVHHGDEQSIDSDIELMIPCIEELQEYQKECIKLFYLEEHSYKEVADMTGHEVGKVKSYIQNGKRNVKNCIENRRGEG